MPYINPYSVTRKRKRFGDPEEEDTSLNVNPDNIDFSAANSPRPMRQGGGVKNILLQMLSSLPQAIGVGMSQDPAAALIQQLSQQRQMQMQQAQMAAEERRAELEAFNREKLEKMRIEGQKSITGMEITARKEGQQVELAGQKELKNMGFANEKQMQEAQFGNQEKITRLTQDFMANEAANSRDFQMIMEEAKTTNDIQQVTSKTVLASLLHAKANSKFLKGADISMSDITSIADKLGKGEPLTKSETEAVDRAYKIQGAMQAAMMNNARRGSGGSGTSSSSKDATLQRQSQLDWDKNRRDLASAVLLRTQEPMIDPVSGQPIRDAQGKIQMQFANGAELGNRIKEIMDIHDAINPQPQIQNLNQNAASSIQPQDAIQAQINAQIDANWNAYTPQAMNKMIDDDPNLNPAQKRQAKAYVNSKSTKPGNVRLKGMNPFGR